MYVSTVLKLKDTYNIRHETSQNLFPAMVAEQFRAYDQIQVDCHLKTQVQIPLKACYHSRYKLIFCYNGPATGVLLWDFSAAFDTLDVELLCKFKPQIRARPRATQQGCTKCGGTSLCQQSLHRKKLRRKVDNNKKTRKKIYFRFFKP